MFVGGDKVMYYVCIGCCEYFRMCDLVVGVNNFVRDVWGFWFCCYIVEKYYFFSLWINFWMCCEGIFIFFVKSM